MSRRGHVVNLGPRNNITCDVMDDCQIASIVAAILWASGRVTKEQAAVSAADLMELSFAEVSKRDKQPESLLACAMNMGVR